MKTVKIIFDMLGFGLGLVWSAIEAITDDAEREAAMQLAREQLGQLNSKWADLEAIQADRVRRLKKRIESVEV